MTMTATRRGQVVTAADLESLAIEASALAQKMHEAAEKIRRSYSIYDAEPSATHAVVFARVGAAGADLAQVLLALMANKESRDAIAIKLGEVP